MAYPEPHNLNGIYGVGAENADDEGDKTMDTENTVAGVYELLERADTTTTSLFDASKSLGAVILACGKLLEVIEDQQQRIEALEAKVFDEPGTYDLRKGRQ
jgi:hypothetical protein